MIKLVKIGYDYYKANKDKNSGSYEVRNIFNSLRKNLNGVQIVSYEEIVNGLKFNEDDVLIFISGIISDDDEYENFRNFLEIAQNKKVLIQTDCRIQSKMKFGEVLKFDLILSQDAKDYNYVPESFVTNSISYTEKLVDERVDTLVFGGNVDGRSKHLSEIFNKAESCKIGLYLFMSSKVNNVDHRLPYPVYKKVCDECKYTVVVSDDICLEGNFITSRFHEALDNNLIPFVDINYDRMNLVVPQEYVLIYNSPDEFEMKLKLFKNDPIYRGIAYDQLNGLKRIALYNQKNLAMKIEDIMK